MPNPKGVKKSSVRFIDHGPPRLFMSLGSAKTALRLWCAGVWHIETAWETTNEYDEGYHVQGLPVPDKKKARDATQYEIVGIDMIVRSIS